MYGVTQTIWVIKLFVHRDTHKCLMRFGVILFQIVRIVGRDNFNVGFFSKFQNIIVNKMLIGNTMTHNF